MLGSHEMVLSKVRSLYAMLFAHNGYGEMAIEIRYLRKREKEVLIKCGKQFRFVVPCDCPGDDGLNGRADEFSAAAGADAIPPGMVNPRPGEPPRRAVRG